MAWRGGSVTRSLISNARSSSLRSSIPPPLRSSAPPLPGLHLRRSPFSIPTRNLGALGCTQSLIPLHSVVADSRLTSYIFVDPRSCCELSQGT